MTRARNSADLASQGNLFADISNDRIGIGSVVPTHKLHVAGTSKFDDDVKFEGTTAANNVLWDKSANALDFLDDTKAIFGTGEDLKIYHNSSNNHSYITETGSGSLVVLADDFYIQDTSTNSMIQCIEGGQVQLHYAGNKKLETTNTGAKVTGNLEVTGVLTYDDVTSIDSVGIITARDHININADNKQLRIGAHADGDLLAYHDGNKSVIVNYTGDFHLRSNNGSRASKEGIILKPNGATELYHSGNKKFETSSTGVTATGDMNISDGTGQSHYQITQTNGNTVKFGIVSGSDIELSGSSNNSMYFKTNNTERLRIDGSGLIANGGLLPSNYGSPNLLISGTDSTLTLMGNGSTNNTSFTGIKFRVAGGGQGDYTKAGIFSRREGGYNDLSLIFALDTVADATSVSIADEKMRITSAGKVGINESSPNRLLYISDDSNTAYSSTSGSNGAVVRLHNKNGSDNSGVNNHVGIEMYVANGATTVGMLSMVRTGNNTGDFTYKTRTGSSTYKEHLRIESSGHMGLGITPSDIDSIGRALNIASSTGGAIYLQDTDAPTSKFAAISYNGSTAALQIHAHHSSSYIDFGTNGTERLRITSGGQVNIGGNYTQTSAPLAVTTNANAFGIRLLSGSNSVCDILNNDSAGNAEIRGYYNNNSGTRGEGFRIEANGESFFNPGGNTGLRIKADGEVRIGANSTAASTAGDDFVIEGSSDRGLSIISGSSSSSNIYFGDSNDADIGRIAYQHNDNALDFSVNAGGTKLRIASNGKLYIGAEVTDFSDAGTFLNLRNNTYGGRIGFSNNTGTAGVTLMEQFAYWGTNKVAGMIATAGTSNSNKDDGYLTFYTKAAGVGAAERLRITSTGLITNKGTWTNTYAANDTTQCGYQAQNLSNTTNTYAAIRLTAGSSSPATAQIASIRTGTGQNDLTFQLETGNTAFEALRITSGGSVHIGNTYTANGGADNLIVGTGQDADGWQGITIYSHSNDGGALYFADGASTGQYAGFVQYSHGDNSLQFGTGSSERLRIDSSGRLLINKTSDRGAYYGGTFSGYLQIEGTGNLSRLTQFVHNTNDHAQHILVLGKSRGTSVGSYTVVQNSDYLGTLSFQGADGDAMIEGARIDAIVSGTPGDQDMPTALTFGTTADGASSTTERLRITSTGMVNIGTNNQASGHAASSKLRVGTASGSDVGVVVFGNSDTTTPALIITNWDGSQTSNKSVIHFDNSGWGTFQIGAVGGADAFGIFDDQTERLRIDSSGRIGIGKNNQTRRLHVASDDDLTTFTGGSYGTFAIENSQWDNGDYTAMDFLYHGTTKPVARIASKITSSGSYLNFGVSNNYSTGITHEAMTIDYNGKIGINNNAPLYEMHFKNAMSSSPSWIHMEVTGSNTVGGGGGIAFDTSASNNATNNSLYLATVAGIRNSDDDGSNDLVFSTSKSGVNSNLPSEKLRIKSDSSILHTRTDNSQRYDLEFRQTGGIGDGNFAGVKWTQGSTGSTFLGSICMAYSDTGRPDMVFYQRDRGGSTGSDEGFRLTRDGNLTTCETGSFSRNNIGFTARKGDSVSVTRNNGTPLEINRAGNDGALINFYQAGSHEGSVTVSGSSISYGGGVLTRWSQLVGISTNVKSDRPTIYQGTVMSNLDEMCEWTGEENMQLNKTQVSTASGDKNVAGVFWGWDDDDDTYTNDFFVAQTGDYIIRVGAATTVTRGDLLESAGDGTAKPQSDDIVRSKTVAKVTSGIAHTTYADGSKAYPCVLMAS